MSRVLALAALLSACARGESTTLVLVSVEGLPPDTRTLRVLAKVDGVERARRDISSDLNRFELLVPSSGGGRLSLSLSALRANRCQAASGAGEATMHTGPMTLNVALSPLPRPLCTLEVAVSGDGDGVISSDPKGISCGTACSADYPVGTRIVLSATPAEHHYFAGWGGDCTGQEGCELTLDQSRHVLASLHTWTVLQSGSRNWLRRVFASAPDDVWAVGFGGTLLRFDGTRWAAVPAGRTSYLFGVFGTGRDDVWVVGENGLALHFDGTRLVPVAGTGNSLTLFSVWQSGRDDVWAVGKEGLILNWNGSAWARYQSGTSATLYGVWGSAKDDIWVVGEEGTLLHYEGRFFVSIKSGTSASLFAVWGSGQDDVWAVGQTGTVLRVRSGMVERVPMDTRLEAGLFGVWGPSGSEMWVVGERGTILRFDGTVLLDAGSGISTGSALSGVFGAGQDVFAVGMDGTILRRKRFTGSR